MNMDSRITTVGEVYIMFQTIVTDNYNYDILSFINVMTSDPFYVKIYQQEYDMFYPLLSTEVKEHITNLVSSTGVSNMAPFFTTIISSIPNNRNLKAQEMLTRYEDISEYMKSFPYYDLYKDHLQLLPQISGIIIQLLDELEQHGFKDYWRKEKYPLIQQRCSEVSGLLNSYNIRDYITKYKELSSDDIIVYLSCYANPHGTRLFGNVLLLDIVYSDKIIVNNVAHELFHPPYKHDEAQQQISALAQFDFVKQAYINQNPQFAYNPIEMFIEECIVEALAIHVVNTLNLEDKPFEYFKKHDEGSHVISPHLYRYLKLKDIHENEDFNQYLTDFIEYLSTTV